MKCRWVQENIELYLYDELADGTRRELEEHVAECAACHAELGQARQLHHDLEGFAAEEPSAGLLADSRIKLTAALETSRQTSFVQSLLLQPAVWFRQVRLAPALAGVIFFAGFTGGVGTAYKLASRNESGNPPMASEAERAIPLVSSVSGIRSIIRQPDSNQVNIQYETVSMREAKGSLNDPHIQQLLVLAARGNYDPGVRMDSVDVLTEKCTNPDIREALAYSLRYDTNPGVRLKSLEALKPYVKSDVNVRDTLLSALLNDSNSGVRAEALHSVQAVKADSSVRAVLQKLARQDDSRYIRTEARAELADLPEIY